MGLLSKAGEGLGGLAGAAAGMAADIAKAGAAIVMSPFKAANPEDTGGFIGGAQSAISGVADKGAELAQNGLQAGGRAAGQAADDMIASLGRFESPSIPDMSDKTRGIV